MKIPGERLDWSQNGSALLVSNETVDRAIGLGAEVLRVGDGNGR